MSEPRAPMRRVAIAGAGQLGVLAALAIKRALPTCEVTVVGLPIDPAAFADRAPTALPFTNRLHDRLGIAEQQIVREAGGSHRLVWRLFGWSRPGEGRAMAYGADTDPALRTRFAREWGGGDKRAGTRQPTGSIAEALADAGRFAIPQAGTRTPLVEVDYAIRWHSPAYRDLLIARARQIGVAHLPDPISGIEPDTSGGIASVHLASGQRLEADLFLDCSGPAASLLAKLPQYRLEDWSRQLPVRQVLLAKPGAPMLALEDRLTLLAEGWLSELAGRDGLQVALGIAPGIDEPAAIAALQAEPLGMVGIEPGCVAQPWLGNVVALGDAAARFEPLGQFNLDLAHRQLDLLLELLPGQSIDPLERAEYNRRAGLMMDRVRDTLTAIYAAPGARDVFGDIALSGELDVSLDQFARRGRIPFREEAPLSTAEFQALVYALGYEPGMSAAQQVASPDEGDRALQLLAHKTRAALDFAPPYEQWMASVLGASQVPAG